MLSASISWSFCPANAKIAYLSPSTQDHGVSSSCQAQGRWRIDFQGNFCENGERYANPTSWEGKKSQSLCTSHLERRFQHTNIWFWWQPAFGGSVLNSMQITLAAVHIMTCKKWADKIQSISQLHLRSLNIFTLKKIIMKKAISFKDEKKATRMTGI